MNFITLFYYIVIILLLLLLFFPLVFEFFTFSFFNLFYSLFLSSPRLFTSSRKRKETNQRITARSVAIPYSREPATRASELISSIERTVHLCIHYNIRGVPERMFKRPTYLFEVFLIDYECITMNKKQGLKKQ
jgi:hypothetical protein